jgi:hypothetical protein
MSSGKQLDKKTENEANEDWLRSTHQTLSLSLNIGKSSRKTQEGRRSKERKNDSKMLSRMARDFYLCLSGDTSISTIKMAPTLLNV